MSIPPSTPRKRKLVSLRDIAQRAGERKIAEQRTPAKTYRIAPPHPASDPLTLCDGCGVHPANPNDPAGYCDECRMVAAERVRQQLATETGV
jgi:hypothetical protein